MTQGVVSATERVLPGTEAPLVDFIQTDSAINPGGSGGPLLNLYAEVAGINTAVIASAQLFGFAMPIDTVKNILPLLILCETQRGWLGINTAPEDGETYTHRVETGLNPGVEIGAVDLASPAASAGLRAGDRIVAGERHTRGRSRGPETSIDGDALGTDRSLFDSPRRRSPQYRGHLGTPEASSPPEQRS